jgi:hypothetical protein
MRHGGIVAHRASWAEGGGATTVAVARLRERAGGGFTSSGSSPLPGIGQPPSRPSPRLFVEGRRRTKIISNFFRGERQQGHDLTRLTRDSLD